MSSTSRLPRNILYSFALQLWIAIIQFFWVPFLMNSMGHEEYGIFTLLLTISWSFLFLDLGVGSALMKYIPELSAQGEKDKLVQYSRVGATIAGGTALLGGLAVAILAPLFVFVILKIPVELQFPALYVFIIAAIGLALNVVWNTLASIPRGFQRFGVFFHVQATIAGLSALAVVWGVEMHYSIPLLAILYTLGSLGSCVGFYAVCRIMIPNFRITPYWDKEAARQLLRIGGWVTVGAIAGQLMLVIDRMILGNTQSMVDVGYFFVIAAIGGRLPLLSQVVSQALLPTASGMVGKGEWNDFRDLFERSLRVVTVILLPIVIVTCVMGKTLFSLWLNPAFIEAAYWPLVLMMIGFFVSAFGAMYGVLSMLSGQLRAYAFSSVMTMALYLTMAWPLTRTFGMLGLSSAFLFSQIVVTGTWMIWLRRKVLEAHLLLWFQGVERLWILSFFLGVATYLVEQLQLGQLTMALAMALALILSFYTVSFMWVLDSIDRAKILKTLGWKISL